MGVISVILPITTDASRLDRMVLHTQYEAGLWPTEIIVANANTNAAGERVAAMAAGLGVRVIDCPNADRSAALNCGAAAATGEVLFFVAPDSLVPRRFAESIWMALRRPSVVGGGFDIEFDPFPYTHGLTKQSLRVVRLLSRIRFRWTGNFGLEQGIFVRREVFEKIGGFQRVKRLEDLYFSRAMKRRGRTATLGPPMQTSARRFLRGGVVREFVADLLMLATDGFGWHSQAGYGKFPRNKPQLSASSEVVQGKD